MDIGQRGAAGVMIAGHRVDPIAAVVAPDQVEPRQVGREGFAVHQRVVVTHLQHKVVRPADVGRGVQARDTNHIAEQLGFGPWFASGGRAVRQAMLTLPPTTFPSTIVATVPSKGAPPHAGGPAGGRGTVGSLPAATLAAE